jgi:hypothetical protein
MAGGGTFTVGKVTGVDALGITLMKLEREWLQEMERGITAEAIDLMNQANTIAPEASGTLKASTVVSVEVESGVRVLANATYTDRKAAAVHEGIHWGIRQKDREARPYFKWFERTWMGMAEGAVQRMLARCLAVIERGKGASE